jgi:hypothetical protein
MPTRRDRHLSSHGGGVGQIDLWIRHCQVPLVEHRDMGLNQRPQVHLELHSQTFYVRDLLVNFLERIAAVFQNHLSFLLSIPDDKLRLTLSIDPDLLRHFRCCLNRGLQTLITFFEFHDLQIALANHLFQGIALTDDLFHLIGDIAQKVGDFISIKTHDLTGECFMGDINRRDFHTDSSLTSH